jgi:hypothetical protein
MYVLAASTLCFTGTALSVEPTKVLEAFSSLVNKGLSELAYIMSQNEQIMKDIAILKRYKACTQRIKWDESRQMFIYKTSDGQTKTISPESKKKMCRVFNYKTIDGQTKTINLDEEVGMNDALKAANNLTMILSAGIFGTSDKPGVISNFFDFVSAFIEDKQKLQKIKSIKKPMLDTLTSFATFIQLVDQFVVPVDAKTS